MKAIQPRILTIIMTGYADLDVPIRAARVHADDYLLKPFALSSFLQSIRSVLEWEGGGAQILQLKLFPATKAGVSLFSIQPLRASQHEETL